MFPLPQDEPRQKHPSHIGAAISLVSLVPNLLVARRCLVFLELPLGLWEILFSKLYLGIFHLGIFFHAKPLDLYSS